MTVRGVDFTGIAYLVAIGAVGVVIVYAWTNRDAIKRAINPADEKNLVNQAANAAVVAVTGGAAAGGEDSVGGLIARGWEFLSGTSARIEQMKRGDAAASKPWEQQLQETWGGAL